MNLHHHHDTQSTSRSTSSLAQFDIVAWMKRVYTCRILEGNNLKQNQSYYEIILINFSYSGDKIPCEFPLLRGEV